MQIATPSRLVFAVSMAGIVGGTLAIITRQAVPSVGAWPGVALGLILLVILLRQPLRRWRVKRRSLPSSSQAWLEQHVRLYRHLDLEGRRRFERDVLFVLDEYSFEGVQDTEITDELRLGVAAGVALLLHGRPNWDLPGTRTFLFYPDRFDDDYYGGTYADYDGMAHEQGPTIFTAESVYESWAHPDDGDNVVLHELAHHFDFDNVSADGVPSLIAPESAEIWQDLVQREMKRIRLGRSILRPYAAEAPSEFFAVATEVFFEQPEPMKRRHRELFDALQAFYQVNPITGDEPTSSTPDIVTTGA